MTMAWLARLLGRNQTNEAEWLPLWQNIVAIARQPDWYARGGVADSLAGRFDMLVQVLALVMLRMECPPAIAEGPARLTEHFIADLEGQLRQQGIGDPTVGKRMGELMSALGGRLGALREALAEGDEALLAAVGRNVTLNAAGDPGWVAGELRRLEGRLARTGEAALRAGEIAR
jgi:cytochrome b pre-mRNA-processing protein 3